MKCAVDLILPSFNRNISLCETERMFKCVSRRQKAESPSQSEQKTGGSAHFMHKSIAFSYRFINGVVVEMWKVQSYISFCFCLGGRQRVTKCPVLPQRAWK